MVQIDTPVGSSVKEKRAPRTVKNDGGAADGNLTMKEISVTTYRMSKMLRFRKNRAQTKSDAPPLRKFKFYALIYHLRRWSLSI